MLSNKLRNKKIKFFLPFLALAGKALSNPDKPVITPSITTNIEELLPIDQTKSIPKDMVLEICKYLPGDNKFVNEMVRAYPTNNNTYKNIAKKFIEKVIDIETEENIDNLLDQYFKTSKINIKPKIKTEILKALPEYLHLLIEKKAPLIEDNGITTEISSIFHKILEDLVKYSLLNDNINNEYLQKLSQEKIINLKEELKYNLETCELLIQLPSAGKNIVEYLEYFDVISKIKEKIEIINNYLDQA